MKQAARIRIIGQDTRVAFLNLGRAAQAAARAMRAANRRLHQQPLACKSCGSRAGTIDETMKFEPIGGGGGECAAD